MVEHLPYKALILWPLIKGLVIAGVTIWILGTTFVQSLIIAAVSGTLGIIGMVLGAWIAAWKASEEARHNRSILQDIKAHTDTNRREGDKLDAQALEEA